jgi:glycine oxidase
MNSKSHPDALIVGGGLIGCSVARALAAEGLSVTVVEREAPGAGASNDAAGMLAPQAELDEGGPFLDLCVESARMFPALADELFTEVGVDIRYRRDGSFAIAFHEAEVERLRHIATVQTGLGLRAELLDPATARRLEPALSESVAAVLSIPDDHQVDNRRLTQAISASCRVRGVTFVEKTTASRLLFDETERVVGVEASGSRYEAGVTIVAAGCWSGQIVGFPVPVEPVKGQMLALDLVAPPFARVLRSERCYLVSRIDGRILIGSTMERVGFDQSVSVQTVSSLLSAAWELVPSLVSAAAGEAWAGLRPATPDGLPAIGELAPGLIAATGHFRNGILLSPITASLVRDVVMGKEPHRALPILDPRRFGSGSTSSRESGE